MGYDAGRDVVLPFLAYNIAPNYAVRHPIPNSTSMYSSHFGLSESPFRITPHTDFFYSGANRGATLDALLYAITHGEGIVKVSGEVGTGKTMLCRMLLERLPDGIVTVFLANPTLSRDEILHAIADELEINVPDARPNAMMRALQERLISLYADARQVVLLVDEAHAMPAETLEQIRLLSNLESSQHKLLQIVLFGQPELNVCLNRPEMRQLKDRITHHFRLEPLSAADVASYLEFRMRAAGFKGPNVFGASAVNRLARASRGLTRRINVLADKALLAAFAEDTHQVLPRHVKAAIRDSEIGPHGPNPRLLWAGAVVLALASISVGAWWWQQWKGGEAAAAHASASTANDGRELVPPAEAFVRFPTPLTAEASVAHGDDAWTLRPEAMDQAQSWLEAAAGDRWSLHLLTADARSDEFVRGFVRRNARLVDPAQLRAYRTENGGTGRINVIYGEYASHADARAALAQLPAPLRAYSPYPRQIRHLR